jgi:D-alanyl-D-alanine carboxypeptidase
MPEKTNKTKLIVIVLALLFIVLLGTYLYLHAHAKKETTSSKQTTTFNKSLYSITNAASLWVIVNKQRPLPPTYVPQVVTPNVALRENNGSQEMKVRAETAQAVTNLMNAAKKDGLNLLLVSGYRSYDAQKNVYDSYVRTDGRAHADTYSARPGHSEHQTGLAVDLGNKDRTCELDVCFGDTPAGKWIAAHASDYGFVLRYPKGSQAIVGYEYEPWHIRYVGLELAKEVKQSGKTLEELFNLPAAPTYN